MELLLITAIPFLLAILLAIRPFADAVPKHVRTWSLTAIMLALFISLLGYIPIVSELGAKDGVIQSLEWVPELGLSLSFYLDGIALLFALIVSGIGAGITLYAGYYFEDADEQRRFLMYLLAFAGAMLGVVMAGNLIFLFIMWEMTSITSFLLIGFKGNKYADARFGAMQAFWITGAGALAFIVGIVLFGFVGGELIQDGGFVFDLPALLALDPQAVAGHGLYPAMLILLAMGAFTKSAQFPFHFWLPGAMAAPTPASAYLHSATMVKAGIYLMLRLYPPMHTGDLWTLLLVGIGGFTFFMGATFALSNRDLKGLLAYLTVSMLGGIMALIGLPDYIGIKAALITILAHALYKAALFLVVGTIDHNTGTRNIDKLGGMFKHMPAMAVIVAVSALSMAGLFPLFGFAAKEFFLDAFYHFDSPWMIILLSAIVVGAIFTVTAAFILIWDIFFREAPEEIHYHASPLWLTVVPGALAVGTVLFGFGISLIEPLIQAGVPKDIKIYLLPPEFWTLVPFWLSTTAIVIGFVFFLIRRRWWDIVQIPIKGTEIYRGLVNGINRVGDGAVMTQSGQVRYYLVIILGTMALYLIITGQFAVLAQGNEIVLFQNITVENGLRILLLGLAVVVAFYSTTTRYHLNAALALGVMGYAVGGIYLLEPAPDVALVQLLVETLATVLVILILAGIRPRWLNEMIEKLWHGRTHLIWYNEDRSKIRRDLPIGIARDMFIAGMVGVSVFAFVLTALVNRPERETIASFFLAETYNLFGVTDVVGAVVADFRAMDTFIEIGVFAAAALGVLSLLTRGFRREISSDFTPDYDRQTLVDLSELKDKDAEADESSFVTPFTRLISRIVLPLTFLIALSHIINGSNAPGDGFTAGAISGLVVSLWYVVFGFATTKKQLGILNTDAMLRVGLFLAVINGAMPLLISDGAFLGYLNYGAMLGIEGFLNDIGLKLTSTLLFEIGIALTVYGGITAIMEALVNPKPEDNPEPEATASA
jgi:NADH:ubiquinone oxidoreductase subunit 5 (subunit L)/multisubunit Na+/H+ antiporter MnhA subunit/multisubunit Na+/H+ antiporter MnhB subunit